jgi:Mce-associated membrane protein
VPNPTLRAATVRAAAKRAERAARQPNEPETTPAASDPTPRRGRRPGLLGAVLAVLVVLGVVAGAVLGWSYREAERTAQARTAALAAAQKAAPAILSYDHRHLDRDFAAARAHLTGPFLDQYGKTTKTVVAPTAQQYRGVVKATVAKPPSGDAAPAASVVSASPDEVVVLLFMNQLTTSTQVATPRLDLNRVRMTLVPTPQGWKVSAVDAL